MTQRQSIDILQGGLDLVTPAAAMPAGRAIGAVNYEPIGEGYARVGGFERLDGRPKPHLASYWILRFDEGIDPPAVGAIVTGATSGATGIVLAPSTATGGEYGASMVMWGADRAIWGADNAWWGRPAYGYMVLAEITGDFVEGESLTVAGVEVGTADGPLQEFGAPTDAEQIAYLSAAVERRRALIQQVPGSGPVRGVAVFQGEAYAIRNNAAGTAGVLHRATSSGWVQIPASPVIAFTNGTARFQDGENLIRLGGSIGIIRRAVTTGGDYSAGTATGYLVMASVGPYTPGAATSESGAGMIAAAVTPTIPPGGRYDFTINAFRSSTAGARLYFAGGVGRAWEWDRTQGCLAEIRAIPDDDLDKPTHVAHFQNHLFLAFAGGSVLHSGPGAPLDFRTTAGAGEIVFGTQFTGFAEASSTALAFAGIDRMSYLTGTSAADFVLQELAEDSGARPWTIQTVGRPIYMDMIGIRDLTTTADFGGWRRGTLTDLVVPLFRARKPTSRASVRVRTKDQYRVYWAGGGGLTVYVGREKAEAMPFHLPIAVTCATSGLNIDGDEIILLGGADGFVYQADVGTSFDGAPIEAMIRLAYNHAGSPYRNKVFHSGQIEMSGEGPVSMMVIAEYGYGDSDLPADREEAMNASVGGGLYNLADWDRFIWSAHEKGLASFDLDGFGPNVSVAFLSSTATEAPHTLSTLILNYGLRGIVR